MKTTDLSVALYVVFSTFYSVTFSSFRRLRNTHRGRQRAFVAVAHSILIAIYHILKEGRKFVDLGSDYYIRFNKERKAEGCLKKLKQLGYAANIATIAELA